MDSSDFRIGGTLNRDLRESTRGDGGHGGSVPCGGAGVDVAHCVKTEEDLPDPLGFPLRETVG